ncbi:hypothetical protein TorRG33x02_262130 [Trema orientale]|uniref:Uncharacterized protein n=1 Tax=Trema orientale TaxID=63057 RepID=A0A2P5D5A1_TREOI|nr:hypothetical protein TorRG33x02_262130 [Trema orientale]
MFEGSCFTNSAHPINSKFCGCVTCQASPNVFHFFLNVVSPPNIVVVGNTSPRFGSEIIKLLGNSPVFQRSCTSSVFITTFLPKLAREKNFTLSTFSSIAFISTFIASTLANQSSTSFFNIVAPGISSVFILASMSLFRQFSSSNLFLRVTKFSLILL